MMIALDFDGVLHQYDGRFTEIPFGAEGVSSRVKFEPEVTDLGELVRAVGGL